MEYQRTSYVFSQEELDGFAQDIQSMRTRLAPTLVTLPPDGSKRLQSVGDKTHPFVEQALKYAQDFPHLHPGSFGLAEFQTDWNLTMQLKELIKNLETVVDEFKDTYLAAGGDANEHARAFYKSAKTLADHNVKNAKPVYIELKKRYGRIKTEGEEPEPVEKAA